MEVNLLPVVNIKFKISILDYYPKSRLMLSLTILLGISHSYMVLGLGDAMGI